MECCVDSQPVAVSLAVDKNSNEEKGETHKSFRSLDRVLVSVRHRKRERQRKVELHSAPQNISCRMQCMQ